MLFVFFGVSMCCGTGVWLMLYMSQSRDIYWKLFDDYRTSVWYIKYFVDGLYSSVEMVRLSLRLNYTIYECCFATTFIIVWFEQRSGSLTSSACSVTYVKWECGSSDAAWRCNPECDINTVHVLVPSSDTFYHDTSNTTAIVVRCITLSFSLYWSQNVFWKVSNDVWKFLWSTSCRRSINFRSKYINGNKSLKCRNVRFSFLHTTGTL